MLVLSRKAAQQIVLSTGSETVMIEILKITGNRVHVGIIAPSSVAIRRQEISAIGFQPVVQGDQQSDTFAVA
jgi:carbon storage regulator CsrA